MNAHDTAVSAPEDKFRMNAAEHLDAMLGHCARMLEISQDELAGKDGALMLSSAARLITAGATAALAQLRVSLGETRHRAISEKGIGLNSKFPPPLPKKSNEEIRAKLEQRINRYIAAAEQQRAREADQRQATESAGDDKAA